MKVASVMLYVVVYFNINKLLEYVGNFNYVQIVH